MMDTEIAGSIAPLSPRQDRLETAIIATLRSRGTRNSLRVLVEDYADRTRVQGTPLDAAVSTMKAIAMRAGPDLQEYGDTIVGESISDRITLMVRWLRWRYQRAD